MERIDAPSNQPDRVAEVLNPVGKGRVLLVCEHASNHIPERYANLGLDEAALRSHIAWDPGALSIAERLSTFLSAPLVIGHVSRLVYDCNRPPDAEDAIPAQSEIYPVPGNQSLADDERAERITNIYEPFKDLLARSIRQNSQLDTIVTVHSFTPVYNGKPRAVEIGVLHGEDPALADAMLALAGDHTDMIVRRNEPYGPQDGVAHTLDAHGSRNGLLNVMLEIRNDLIATKEDQDRIATVLGPWIDAGIRRLNRGRAA